MVKTITKVGNSHGIIFDARADGAPAHVEPGDQMNVEIHESGTITLTPISPGLRPRKCPR